MCKNDRRRKKTTNTPTKKNIKIKNKKYNPKTKNPKSKKIEKFLFFFVKLHYLSLFNSQKNSYGSNLSLVEK